MIGTTTTTTTTATPPISSYCHEHKHPDFWQFTGSPEAELLALESHELIHAVEATLQRALQLTASTTDDTPSIEDAMPIFSLSFNRLVQSTTSTTEADRPLMLQAFAKLMHQSQKLDASPEVKTAFWATIAKNMVGLDATNLVPQLFARPDFPQFAIHCGRGRFFGGNWSEVNQELCHAIADFATATVSPSPSPAPAPISLTLSFAAGSPELALTFEQLELIEALLDRIARPTLPSRARLSYQITTLDLSNNILPTAAQLEVVARIVAKCTSGYYQIEQLKLDALIPTTATVGYRPLHDPPRAFTEITTCAAFHSDAAAATATSSMLRKVSLSQNVLTSSFFEKHFSALRYGCPLEQDLTTYAVQSYQGQDQAEIVDAWRWLAFGLFYPRPQRFGHKYKLRRIGKLVMSSLAIRTIVNTLRDPAEQLVGKDMEGRDRTMVDSLMVCTVKKGARIDPFSTTTTTTTTTTTMVLQETSELEALWERDDGSVCVVVPGAGLGWVDTPFVVAIEREPLDLARSAHDGLYHVAISVDQTGTDLRPLFSSIGHQLQSLTLDFQVNQRGPLTETVAQLICDHCTHLQHLNVTNAPREEIRGLIQALAAGSSALRGRLRTLNLNGNDNTESVDDAAITRLASILADTSTGDHHPPPALEELRLAQCGLFQPESLARLHDALLVNRTLVVLELSYLKHSTAADEDVVTQLARFEASFQGQLLRADSPLETKLAFLSVVGCKSARFGLDKSLVKLVLAFAACQETRRMVAWNHEELVWFEGQKSMYWSRARRQ